jgi:predicted Fe-Mo cluster-binding NifX family protein
LIHAEPVQRTHLWYAAPLANVDGTLSEHFGEAPYFALVRVRLADEVVEEQRIVANSFLEEEKAKGIQVAEWLVAQKIDVVLVKESLRGKGPVYVFRDAGIELRQTDVGTLTEAMRGLRERDR